MFAIFCVWVKKISVKESTCLPIIFLYVFMSGCYDLMSQISEDEYYVASRHRMEADRLLKEHRTEEAIQQYKLAIQKGRSAKQHELTKLMLFTAHNNLATCLSEAEEKRYHFEQAAKVFPERAYYPYLGLGGLAYNSGQMDKYLEYAEKAYDLVNRPGHEAREESSRYQSDTMMNLITANLDHARLEVGLAQVNEKKAAGKYEEARTLAKELLGNEYAVGLGISVHGSLVVYVSEQGVGGLNGIVEGDKLLGVNEKAISKKYTATDALADLHDTFGRVVPIKLERNGREIVIECRMYYPRLEQLERIYRELDDGLNQGILVSTSKDTEPPAIKVLAPRETRGIRVQKTQSIEFMILAADAFGIKGATIDGRPFEPAETSQLDKASFAGKKVQRYTKTVFARPGNNVFHLRATDTSGNTTDLRVEVQYEEKVDLHGSVESLYQNSVAIVIGIDNYLHWPTLECALADAKAVRQKLVDLGFQKVFELYDKEASRLQIMHLIAEELPRLLKEDDRLLVYFAGHGQTETYFDQNGQKVKEGYIIPVDGDKADYRGSAISMASMHQAAKRFKAKHVLFVFDSCYSGLGLKRSAGSQIQADNYIRKLSTMKAVQILTAGGENEQAGEEKGHGIFTRHLLLALDGTADMDNDGFVTASEIGSYIRPVVSRKSGNSQTPKFGWISGEGDFIFKSSSIK
jgi:hypothetical protein